MATTVSTLDKKIKHCAFVALILLTILLLARGYHLRGEPLLITVPLWDLQYTHRLKDFLLVMLKSGLLQFVLYLSIGFFAALSFNPQPSAGISRITHLYAVIFGVILSIVVSAIAKVDLTPNILDIILPAIGCLIGAWIGVNWAVGGRIRKLIWLKLILFTGALVLVTVVLALLAVDKTPFSFEAEQLKSEDRVRLINLMRSKSPRRLSDNETATLILSERDINLLLTWGLSLGSSDRKARAFLDNESTSIRGSIRFPLIDGSTHYINFLLTGWISVKSGNVDGEIKQLAIGNISLPPFLLKLLSSAIMVKIVDEPLLKPILAQIMSTEINRDHLSLTYRRIDVPEGFRDKIFSSIGSPETMRESLLAQFDMIRQVDDSLPTGEKASVGLFMRSAFILAYQRSENNNPILENRAAIIALGIAIGHRIIAKFINDMPYESIPRLERQITLYRRADWSKHFLISAALEVISSEAISLDIGLLKEELDSGKGGSGFSFGDLAADRSGTMFAKVATSHRESAEAMQLRMVQDFFIGDYVPLISDFPENIPAEKFISDYGGTDGKQYRIILQDIDRRIAHCAAYR